MAATNAVLTLPAAALAAASSAVAVAAALAPLLLMWRPLQQRPKKRSCWRATQLAAGAYGLLFPLSFIQQQLLNRW